MAFEINHRPDADYHLLQFETDKGSGLLDKLDHNLKITDGVLRFRIIRLKDGSPPPPTPRPEGRREPVAEEAADGGAAQADQAGEGAAAPADAAQAAPAVDEAPADQAKAAPAEAEAPAAPAEAEAPAAPAEAEAPAAPAEAEAPAAPEPVPAATAEGAGDEVPPAPPAA
jgi:hypothetical protein